MVRRRVGGPCGLVRSGAEHFGDEALIRGKTRRHDMASKGKDGGGTKKETGLALKFKKVGCAPDASSCSLARWAAGT